MLEKTIRFGIIGAAKIAHKFCAAVRMVDGAEVAAVASNTPGKAKAFAEEEHVADYYDGYDDMLARADIDAVYIATTHNFHYENLKAALNAGKHILCEKPMVLHENEAAEIFAMAKEKHLFCMEAMWSRFIPTICKAKEWVDTGKIGDIEQSYFSIGFIADPDPLNRMNNPKLAGGALYDIGVYAIELTTYLIPQELKQVHSVVTWTDTGVDRTSSITLEYDQCVAQLQCSLACQPKQTMNLVGTKGSILIPDTHYSTVAELYDEQCRLVERFEEPLDNGFQYEVAETVRCIREGRLESNVVPHSTTLQCARIFDHCLTR